MCRAVITSGRSWGLQMGQKPFFLLISQEPGASVILTIETNLLDWVLRRLSPVNGFGEIDS